LEATHKVKGNIYVVPDALSNTTSTRNAYGIAHFIAQKLKSQGMDAKASTITDACAGIGMTAIAFTHFFQKVHVVESNKNTLKWCKANLEMRGVSDRYAMWDTVHDYVSGCAAHHQTVVYLDGEGRKTSYCPYLTTKNGASGPADTTVLDVCSKIGPNATLIVLRMPATFKFNTVVQWCANSNNRFHHPQRSAPIPDDLDAEHKFYLVAIWTGDCKKMTNATPAKNMSFVKSTAPKHATGATHATPPKHAHLALLRTSTLSTPIHTGQLHLTPARQPLLLWSILRSTILPNITIKAGSMANLLGREPAPPLTWISAVTMATGTLQRLARASWWNP